MAAQHVVLAVDKASLVSALPQAPGAAMPRIEQADIVRAEPLHQTANGASVGRCHEEVDMVVHQDVGVQAAKRRGQRLPQKLQVAQSIAIVEEAGEAVVAPLHDVLRDAGKVDTGEAGHACEHARAGGRLQSLQANRAPGISSRSDVGKVHLAPLVPAARPAPAMAFEAPRLAQEAPSLPLFFSGTSEQSADAGAMRAGAAAASPAAGAIFAIAAAFRGQG